MTIQYLFNRAWEVDLGFPGSTGFAYTQLKTVFEIEKNSFGGISNKAKVELYNLSQQSRQIFERKGLQIMLKAGYVGLIKTLMIADVSRMVTKRRGADIITVFECGEGEKFITDLSFNKSYPPGTSYVQIIQDVAQTFQNSGIGIGVVFGLPNLKYNSGVTLSDSCKNILDKLLKKSNLEWSISNNTLNIIPKNSHNGETVIVLSKATGLIGVPAQKESGVEFVALLNPDLTPGAPVQLICGEVAGQLDVYNPDQSSITGYYRIRNAKYEGDSHGEKWFVRCEADRVNPIQALPTNQGINFSTAVVGG